MTEQPLVNRMICKVAYKTNQLLNYQISIFIMGVVFALFSIFFYLAPPKNPDAIQFMSAFGISTITISLFCAILSIVTISTVFVSIYNMNNIKKYLILFTIFCGIICMFVEIC